MRWQDDRLAVIDQRAIREEFLVPDSPPSLRRSHPSVASERTHQLVFGLDINPIEDQDVPAGFLDVQEIQSGYRALLGRNRQEWLQPSQRLCAGLRLPVGR